ncbi:hypothetical protein [Actinokineospora bangkokensis]|uniref:DUF3558 domain-containing protein n=1 Tax=Actinokineospora bangkokensis TaxID=1193682 RepID=A0A1Q9LGB3_9PSEU|nr:hypothetical protein [Actinokineospora bangkokensis]OLR91087.1 hypothetical protein BJP25_31635 [Actinokineospora bangkokensis]
MAGGTATSTAGGGPGGFDPCTVVGWDDLPPAARPTTTPAAPQRPGDTGDAEVQTMCILSHGDVKIDAKGPVGGPPPPGARLFTLVVGWGPHLNTDPTKRAGAQGRTWNGRAGLIDPVASATLPGCVGLVPAAGGVVGVTVISTLPGLDACAVTDTALTVATSRLP